MLSCSDEIAKCNAAVHPQWKVRRLRWTVFCQCRFVFVLVNLFVYVCKYISLDQTCILTFEQQPLKIIFFEKKHL